MPTVDGSTRRFALGSLLAALMLCMMLALSPDARAAHGPTRVLADGTMRTTYRIGPLEVTSGQNKIKNNPIAGASRPSVDGWITRIKPDLVYNDGTIPSSSKVMFHHGVWVNTSRGENFFATGEEKTQMDFPPGYAYRYKASDNWYLNQMIHNLTPEPMVLYATYTIDFIPATDPAAAEIEEVKPIWMDVESGIYPVFDSFRDEGGADGEFVYPQDRPGAYPPGVHKNERTIPRDGVLIGTTGHVHTGGLQTDLYLNRPGASYGGPTCEQPASFQGQIDKFKASIRKLNAKLTKLNRSMTPKKLRRQRKASDGRKFKKALKQKRARKAKLKKAKRKQITLLKSVTKKDNDAKKAYTVCTDTQPEVTGNRVHLFESTAHYFEPAGPVSWDMAMMSTRDDWRVQVKAGDKLELQTTYETERASWYENMGINIVYWSDETDGRDPYVTKVDTEGVLNHGHYAENDDHGGTAPVVGPDPVSLPDGLASGGPITISGYSYGSSGGDFRLPGALGRPPTVKLGQSFTFQLSGSDIDDEIWHSLTSCKSPCNKSTGIAYPIADGEFQFDSGQMGINGAPTVNRTSWSTPSDLPVATPTLYCRIHPLRRRAARVVTPTGS